MKLLLLFILMLFLSCSPYSRLSGLYHYEGKGEYTGVVWYMQLNPDSTFVVSKKGILGEKVDTLYFSYSGKYHVRDKRVYVREIIDMNDVSMMLQSAHIYSLVCRNYRTLVYGEKIFTKMRKRDKH